MVERRPVPLTDRTWEEETASLLDEARKEEHRAEQRVAWAQKMLEKRRYDLNSLRLSLDFYRAANGTLVDEPPFPLSDERPKLTHD